MRRVLPPEEVVNVAVIGLLLVLAGLVLLVIEAHITAFGAFGTAGVVASATGVGLIVVGAGAPVAVAISTAIVLAILGALILVFVGRKVMASRRQEVKSGPERLVGIHAVVRDWTGDDGWVAADGALWSANTSFGWEDPPPQTGDVVIVNQLDGLTLSIRRPHAWEMEPVWKPSELSL